MSKRVFVSYSHHPGDDKRWVRHRIVPTVEAAGVEVLNDYKYFDACRSIIGQIGF